MSAVIDTRIGLQSKVPCAIARYWQVNDPLRLVNV